ncbi:sugar porter family MFS transporter [Pedobacter sp. Hv1]|uniref:sugar porter family MFS transporter n=1 Tax=Pedobacter sp. Hv1 TaxID=1740090 RepID=UPI000AC4185B|nr:sugar porter family MFS transporter [Pedobacter sp. Hv1]
MKNDPLSFRLNFITLTVALGGLLFGFDTAVISGIIGQVRAQFSLNVVLEGWLVSSGLLGCIIGVIITGFISDRIGRKKSILFAGVMFLLSALGCAFANNFNFLVLARLAGGIGVGMASVLSPMYIAEFAPAKSRGRMIAYYQLAITVGILLAYFSNAFLVSIAHNNFQSEWLQWFFTQETWRPMFLMMAIPSIIFLILLLKIPESPRWLVLVNRKDEAHKVLHQIRTIEEASKEIDDIKNDIHKVKKRISLLNPAVRLPLLIGMVLAILQQFSGINAIIYYGPSIFETAGIASDNALAFQVIIGTVNLLFTFVAIRYADKFGRKFLLKTGLTGIVLSLALCGLLFYLGQTSGFLLLILMLVYIACFAFSLGPVTWIIINEVFRTEVRLKGVAICTLALWVAVWLVGQFFPWLLQKAGPAVTFWLFAFFSLINLFFSWRVVKETKNKTLEEMESVFMSPH